MPYLTSSGSREAVAGAYGGLGVGVPGYAHPMVAPADWAALARPGTPVQWVVLDVARGPGARPDPYCRSAVEQLHGAGIPVLGRLDAGGGSRSAASLADDARRFLAWYQVDGFYLHRCPGDSEALPWVRRAAATLCALQEETLDAPEAPDTTGAPDAPGPLESAESTALPAASKGSEATEASQNPRATPVLRRPGRTRLVLAHGTHPSPGYAEVADQLVTFCGSWPDYRWSQAEEWTADYPADRFCHLVHGVPLPHLEEAARIARWQGAATVYFTDRLPRGRRGEHVDPWEAMPGYWDEIVSRLGTVVSE